MGKGLVLIGAVALLLLAGCGGSHGPDKGKAEPPEVAVRVAVVESRELHRQQELPGTVHPADQAVIAAKLMATVAEADFAIGQEVSQGEVLVVLDAEEVTAQVEQAEASVAQLQRNLEREQALFAQSATTAEAVRTLEDEIRVARARLSEAKTMEGYTRLRAPFDGIITSKEVRRGDLAIPGQPLLTVEGKGSLQVYVQVPDSLVAIKYGQMVPIQANGRIIEGPLSEWSPAADPTSRTRLAKIDVPVGTGVRSGQYVQVLWPAETVHSLWIPRAALSRMGQLERAFLFSENRIELQMIKTGGTNGERIQVLAGLNEGDRVVLAPEPTYRDGQPARLLP